MSTPDDPEKKPPQQPTVAWKPEDIPEHQPTIPWTADELAKMAADEAAVEADKKSEDPLVGTLMRGKWKILARLGAGSFGTVYKVEDVKGGWIEALKVLGVDRLSGAEAEEMRKRFLREAQIMKRLGTDSQHIVGLATYEEDIEAGLIYFLMEFVEGKSLGQVLEAEGPFSADRVIQLALQACDALMAAHEGPEPVVHRDLKLENLMLTKDRAGEEMIKVLDFGIAKIAEREADSRLTTVGTLGTPGYAAPEQLRAEEVDGRTDLFAFGVILYALLTGRDPWLGKPAHEPTDKIYELMAATDRGEVIPIARTGVAVPEAMANIVLRLLQRDPASRFQSARDLRDALRRVEAGGMVDAPHAAGPAGATAVGVSTRAQPRSAQRPAAPRPKPRRRRGRAIVALGLMAIGLLGAGYYIQPWGRTLDRVAVDAAVGEGSVERMWLDDGGIGGYLQVGPLVSPFFTPVPETEIPGRIAEYRDAGVFVDTAWEVQRLKELASRAQSRFQYYGIAGGDVLTYAQRLEAVEPGNVEARALLLKVGERMAWDAEAAAAEGADERARELVDRCLDVVPEHPRCLSVQETL